MKALQCEVTGPVGDNKLLHRVLRDAVTAAGCTILDEAYHSFYPQGYTALLLLSESHATVHTWPEDGYALIDYFSCAPDPKIEVFESVLEASGFHIVDRGIQNRHMGSSRVEHPALPTGAGDAIRA